MTKQLAQYSVPAENSRVIRVFLSSTFRDMEMERSALVKLFKGLQVKAASRGATISLVDLRWGITEEDAKSGKVVEICLKEIVNSRPFFIGMVGDRYGWCPSRAGGVRELKATIISSQLSLFACSLRRNAIRFCPSTGRNSRCPRTISAFPIRKAG